MADNDRIGALWRNESAKGEWFSGTIDLSSIPEDVTELRIVVFGNKFKEAGDSKPDFNILKGREKGE